MSASFDKRFLISNDLSRLYSPLVPYTFLSGYFDFLRCLTEIFFEALPVGGILSVFPQPSSSDQRKITLSEV